MTNPGRSAARSAFTLIEVLSATLITLVMMGAVARMFSYVTDSVVDSRALAEMSDQLRNTKQRLQNDLLGVTASTLPPLRPEDDQGYFEIIEGPYGMMGTTSDATLGDVDDILMFTTRGVNEQFAGRTMTNSMVSITTSPLAEVAWFLRGSILYRRVLLIQPTVAPGSYTYAQYDLSMRQGGGQYDTEAVAPGIPTTSTGGNAPLAYPNTLGDLTKRENRFAHQPLAWPYDARFWGCTSQSSAAPANLPTGVVNPTRPGLGLPTLNECAATGWPFPLYGSLTNPAAIKAIFLPVTLKPGAAAGPKQFYIVPLGSAASSTSSPVSGGHLMLSGGSTSYDAWNPSTYPNGNPLNGPLPSFTQATNGNLNNFNATRYDDVVMVNVISFDVKAWDPGAPVFQVQTTSAGTAGQRSALVPGDPAYATAVANFVRNPSPSNTTAMLGSFGAYGDLNYMYTASAAGGLAQYLTALATYEKNKSVNVTPGSLPRPRFAGPPDPRSGIDTVPSGPTVTLPAGAMLGGAAAIYDTWSTHYEHDGIDQDADGLVDEGTDGIDNDGLAGVDDANEHEAPPPYSAPLRGVQIKIRAFEPDSKQIREVTLTHEFLQE